MEKKKWVTPEVIEAWGEDTEGGRNLSVMETGARYS